MPMNLDSSPEHTKRQKNLMTLSKTPELKLITWVILPQSTKVAVSSILSSLPESVGS